MWAGGAWALSPEPEWRLKRSLWVSRVPKALLRSREGKPVHRGHAYTQGSSPVVDRRQWGGCGRNSRKDISKEGQAAGPQLGSQEKGQVSGA